MRVGQLKPLECKNSKILLCVWIVGSRISLLRNIFTVHAGDKFVEYYYGDELIFFFDLFLFDLLLCLNLFVLFNVNLRPLMFICI